MLRGTIRYREHSIDVKGVDSNGPMLFILTANEYATVDMFDEIEMSAGSFYRNVQINPSTFKSEIGNKEFNSIFAGTLRYAKSNCYSKYRDSIFDSTEEVFVPEKTSTYHIPRVGTVKLTLGLVTEMHLETSKIKIDLVEDNNYSETVFFPFDAKSFVFRIGDETLGFNPTGNIPERSYGEGLFYNSLDEIIENNPLRSFSWLLDRDYTIVTDDNLEEVIEHFRHTKKKIAMDTETTGFSITFKSRVGQGDVLVGIILSDEIGKSYYFPLRHKAIKNLCDGDHEFFMARYMKYIMENKKIVCHNGSYDWKVMYIYDINTNIVDDTMIAFQCTYGYKYKDFTVGLKSLISSIFHRDSLELDDIDKSGSYGSNGLKFWDLPYELVRLYACADADNTLELLEYIERTGMLDTFGARKIYEIEVLFSKCVAYQEFYGHRVDIDNIPQLQSDNDRIMATMYQKMRDIVGHDFNPASSQQVNKILYEELGLPVQTKFDKGKKKVTSDKDARKRLMEFEDEEGNMLYPIVYYYNEWCTADTIRKNFLKNLGTLATQDGYMFPEVFQFGTDTGRVSIKRPNYQGYNKPVKLRIKPRPGYYVTDNDYSSIEYRLLACLALETKLIDAFGDPDLNYHTYQASRIFNIPYELVTNDLRKKAKGINFGLPYGMGDASLGERVFGERTPENTRKAAELRKKYFEGQENIERFFIRVRKESVDNGYSVTHYGRRRWYDKTKVSLDRIERQSGNAVIQGTAADVYKIACGRLFLKICENGWLGKALMVAFVHDAITCEVSNEINPMVWLKTVKEAFEIKEEGWCPLYIGFGFGRDWYEAHSVELPVQLQNEFVEKYGEEGYPEWDGDMDKFCEFIEHSISKYETDTVATFITAESNKGAIVSPVVNQYLTQHANSYVKEYNKKKSKILRNHNLTSTVKYDELRKFLHDDKKIQISEVTPDKLLGYKADFLAEKLSLEALKERISDENTYEVVLNEFKEEGGDRYLEGYSVSKELQENLDIFCIVHNIPRDSVDIKAAVLTEEHKNSSEGESRQSNEQETDEYNEEAELLEIKKSRVNLLGVYIDVNRKEATIKIVKNQNIMSRIQSKCNTEGNGYKLLLYDVDSDTTYSTPMYISSKAVYEVQSMFLAIV